MKKRSTILFIVVAVAATTMVLLARSPAAHDDRVPDGSTPSRSTNWKTYHNEEYGYEIKYEPDWLVDEGFQTRLVSFFPSQSVEFLVGVYANDLESLEEAREDRGAIQLEGFHTDSGVFGRREGNYAVHFQREGLRYQISIEGIGGVSERVEEFEDFIKTFDFAD